MNTIRLSVPASASKGEVVELKAMIQHQMESGFRRGARGEVIERDIITRFTCLFNGDEIFSADFYPAIAANPLLSFHMRAEESGRFLFRWTDPSGLSWEETRDFSVT